MLDFLHERRARTPDLPALSVPTASGWHTTTWTELSYAVQGVAERAPTVLGGGRGPVLVSLDGSADSVAVLLGLLAAGTDVVCLENGTSHLADDRSVIWRTGAAAAVLSDSGGDSSGDTGSGAGTTLRGVLVLRYGDLLVTPGADECPAPPAGDSALPRLRREPSVLQLTSGSTGEPRIARHSLGSVLRGARLYREIHGLQETDRVLLPLPLAHSFGLVGGLFAALVSGAELLTFARFSLSAVRLGLERGATVLLGTPLLYSLLAKSLAGALSAGALRVLLSSGGPLHPETGVAVKRMSGRPVRQVYGSTETGLIACQTGADRAWAEDSAGLFAPGVAWRLAAATRDDAGNRVGRLLVRTSTMLTGCIGAETGVGMTMGADGDGTGTATGTTGGSGSAGHAAAGDPPLTDDGYFDTQDLVAVSLAGEVRLLGRKNTFINVGGRKVNPSRVERIVREVHGVADVHVLGLDAGHEQAVHAVVVPSGPVDSLPAGQVLAHCRGRLAAHEVPHHVHVLPVLPRTSMGKVDHLALLAALGRHGPGHAPEPQGLSTNEASRS